MQEYFLDEVNSYLNYFGCLVLGVFVSKAILPNPPKNISLFDNAMMKLSMLTTGVLLGSSFYDLTYPDPYNEDESDSGVEVG